MAKLEFNSIHIDLSDVSLIGKLSKGPGGWFAPVVWRNTGSTVNLKMADEKQEFTIIIGDQQIEEEKTARANYEKLVKAWGTT